MLQAASIVCLEKKGQISNISLSTNTVAECCQVTYMINCVRKPNVSVHAQLLSMRAQTSLTMRSSQSMPVVVSFEVTEELLTIIPVHGHTTSQEIFCQLCDAIMDAGLPRKRFTVEDAPNVLQMELIVLQCNSEIKANFREASGKADKLGQFLRELPPPHLP